jgi:hypothetical protein
MADLLYKAPTNEDAMVAKLHPSYREDDVREAYRILTGLRSARVVGERYWEYPDGRVSLKGPSEIDAVALA